MNMTTFAELCRPYLSPDNPTVALLGEKANVQTPVDSCISLAQLLEDEAMISRIIDQYDAEILAPTFTVAANLWFKPFIRSIIAPWLTQALFGYPVPTNIEHLWVNQPHYRGLYWYPQHTSLLKEKDIPTVISTLCATLTAPFVSLIGRFDTWGSTALGVADPWMSAAKKTPIATEALLMNFAYFQQQLCIELQTAIQAISIDKQDKKIIHFRRRSSCCHKYELPKKRNCATCSKVPLDRQIDDVLQK